MLGLKKEEEVLPNDEYSYFGAFTICKIKRKVETEKGIKIFQGIGISKQSSRDERNKAMGDKVALGRALKAISQKTKYKEIRHQYMS